MGKTCLHRLSGECRECKIDYNLSHHPNNYDCRKYHEITLLETTVLSVESKVVQQKELKENDMDRKISA